MILPEIKSILNDISESLEIKKISTYPVFDIKEKSKSRKKKMEQSRKEQKDWNEKNAKEYFFSKAHCNFDTSDYVWHITFNEEHRPKTLEEAEELTQQTINKPETSEHNLGLAIDFNYVDYDFEKSSAYEWLLENAENYGFILRYPKEKESITKVSYEPWHWRFVGVEHARKINELGMCLEEYIEYLDKQISISHKSK